MKLFASNAKWALLCNKKRDWVGKLKISSVTSSEYALMRKQGRLHKYVIKLRWIHWCAVTWCLDESTEQGDLVHKLQYWKTFAQLLNCLIYTVGKLLSFIVNSYMARIRHSSSLKKAAMQGTSTIICTVNVILVRLLWLSNDTHTIEIK